MKLSHDFFLRSTLAGGCIGTLAHTVFIYFAKPFDGPIPWYGFFAYVFGMCIYGLLWAITPRKWWGD